MSDHIYKNTKHLFSEQQSKQTVVLCLNSDKKSKTKVAMRDHRCGRSQVPVQALRGPHAKAACLLRAKPNDIIDTVYMYTSHPDVNESDGVSRLHR